MTPEFFSTEFKSSLQVFEQLSNDINIAYNLEKISHLICSNIIEGSKVMLAGNGGSAADAQHIAAEFVSRFNFDRAPLPALSLSTDTSIITAISNDYGYENLFTRQIEAYGRPNDIFIGLTTSGLSKNVLQCFDLCKSLNIKTILLTGARHFDAPDSDFILRAPSDITARIQECHILIGHALCSAVESIMFKNENR